MRRRTGRARQHDFDDDVYIIDPDEGPGWLIAADQREAAVRTFAKAEAFAAIP
jgi:hypothetical protein